MRSNINGLVHAIGHCHAIDALRCNFSVPHWEILASYMQPIALDGGQELIEQDSADRTLYFIESGTLSVHYQDNESHIRMALVGAGSVVGEGAYFSHQPRNATVQATGDCQLRCLNPMRFLELSNRHSPIALESTLGMAAVMALRLYIRSKRMAVT